MGIKERQQAARIALEAALTRLGPLPIPQLAAEIMELFRPEGPNATPPDHTDIGLASSIVPDFQMLGSTGYDSQPRRHLLLLIHEGLQALEHASLICVRYVKIGGGSGDIYYLSTRRGLAALWHGTVEASIRADEPRDSTP